jgi:adenosylhomocysteine nucleosidase
VTLACALAVEERAARSGGARVARVGLGASLPLPDGPLVSFGLAGALLPGFPPGTLVTATRIVDETACVLWEGDPLRVAGARRAVVCAAPRVVDEPAERVALAERTGALAVDLETGALAETGRLAGVLRAISDTPDRPVGGLARAATAAGEVAWRVVVRSFLVEPRTTVRAALGARAALASLERAAAALAEAGKAR